MVDKDLPNMASSVSSGRCSDARYRWRKNNMQISYRRKQMWYAKTGIGLINIIALNLK